MNDSWLGQIEISVLVSHLTVKNIEIINKLDFSLILIHHLEFVLTTRVKTSV